MARRRSRGRSVNGILILDKPQSMSSNQALQRVKSLFYANKAGHTGSLDPLATGVLPICLGEATKFSQFVLDSDKRYRSTFRLGIKTETGDSDGDVVSRMPAKHLTEEQLRKAIELFKGDIEQVPSMYSALKHNGQPLYKLARQGIEVEREARQITVFDYQVLEFRPGEIAELDVEIHCSKGTYIRTLAEDLGEALDCGAHVSALRRIEAGPFREGDAISLDELEKLREGCQSEDLDYLLKPMDMAVEDRMAVELPDTVAEYFRLGQPVMATEVYRKGEEGDIVRVFQKEGAFLGVGVVSDDGRVCPKRLVV